MNKYFNTDTTLLFPVRMTFEISAKFDTKRQSLLDKLFMLHRVHYKAGKQTEILQLLALYMEEVSFSIKGARFSAAFSPSRKKLKPEEQTLSHVVTINTTWSKSVMKDGERKGKLKRLSCHAKETNTPVGFLYQVRHGRFCWSKLTSTGSRNT